MLLEAVILFVGYYLLCSLGYYLYAVVKSWEFLGFWNFKIKDGYIGICKYPKFALGWVEWLIGVTTKNRSAR